MASVFGDRISQGRTQSPQPTMKNDFVTQSFRYEALTLHSKRLCAIHFDPYSYFCDFPPPHKFRTKNAPLEQSASLTMTLSSIWILSLPILGKPVTSTKHLENVPTVCPAASPRPTLRLTSNPWRRQIWSRCMKARLW